jgi:hypothetical protein
MNISISAQFKLDSSSVVKVISVLMVLVHFIHICGLR